MHRNLPSSSQLEILKFYHTHDSDQAHTLAVMGTFGLVGFAAVTCHTRHVLKRERRPLKIKLQLQGCFEGVRMKESVL